MSAAMPLEQQATRAFLVRHGATVLTEEDRFAGSIDVPLSEQGREQARRLALRLGREPLAAVYASNLQRAYDTAGIIAKPHQMEVIRRTELREIAHGHWERMTQQWQPRSKTPGRFTIRGCTGSSA
jgi:probable phosphoglycerate mutase